MFEKKEWEKKMFDEKRINRKCVLRSAAVLRYILALKCWTIAQDSVERKRNICSVWTVENLTKGNIHINQPSNRAQMTPTRMFRVCRLSRATRHALSCSKWTFPRRTFLFNRIHFEGKLFAESWLRFWKDFSALVELRSLGIDNVL